MNRLLSERRRWLTAALVLSTAAWAEKRADSVRSCDRLMAPPIRSSAPYGPLELDRNDAIAIIAFIELAVGLEPHRESGGMERSLARLWARYLPMVPTAEAAKQIASVKFSTQALKKIRLSSGIGDVDRARLRQAWFLFQREYARARKLPTGPAAHEIADQRRRALAVPIVPHAIIEFMRDEYPDLLGVVAKNPLRKAFGRSWARFVPHLTPRIEVWPEDHMSERRSRTRDWRITRTWINYLQDLTRGLAHPTRTPNEVAFHSRYVRSIPSDFESVPDDQPRVIIAYLLHRYAEKKIARPFVLTECFRRLREDFELPPRDEGFISNETGAAFYHAEPRSIRRVLEAWARVREELRARSR